jgi:hypothetical protein
MELSNLLKYLRDELDLNRQKKENENYTGKYLIDEINLELHVQEFSEVNGKISAKLLGIGSSVESKINTDSTHKISIKLKPKGQRQNIIIENK